MRTRVTGCSSSSASLLSEPIRNSPAGTRTNSIPAIAFFAASFSLFAASAAFSKSNASR